MEEINLIVGVETRKEGSEVHVDLSPDLKAMVAVPEVATSS